MSQEKKGKQEVSPPTVCEPSLQMDLFSRFIANDDRDLSNLIEMWEGIPKYFLNDKQQKKLRTSDGLAQPYIFEYLHVHSSNSEGVIRSVTIQPALIKQDDGSHKAFFPSVTEELVEEALKKIFTDQNYGLHNAQEVISWVRFSLRMVYRELRDRGRTRSITEIKRAIDVMKKSIVTVTEGKTEIYNGPILADVMPVDREAYEEDPNTHWIARLPAILSIAINKLRFRQFNMARLLECDDQLSRYMFKKLVTHFRQAGFGCDYHFMYSKLEHSGLLMVRANEGRAKVLRALNELVSQHVLITYDVEPRTQGKKILDVKYTVYPHQDFIAEQKAANKRAKDHRAIATEKGVAVDD